MQRTVGRTEIIARNVAAGAIDAVAYTLQVFLNIIEALCVAIEKTCSWLFYLVCWLLFYGVLIGINLAALYGVMVVIKMMWNAA
jgi:hypothetical protein